MCEARASHKLEYRAEANVENVKEFDTLIYNWGSNTNLAGMGNKPRPLVAKPHKNN